MNSTSITSIEVFKKLILSKQIWVKNSMKIYSDEILEKEKKKTSDRNNTEWVDVLCAWTRREKKCEKHIKCENALAIKKNAVFRSTSKSIVLGDDASLFASIVFTDEIILIEIRLVLYRSTSRRYVIKCLASVAYDFSLGLCLHRKGKVLYAMNMMKKSDWFVSCRVRFFFACYKMQHHLKMTAQVASMLVITFQNHVQCYFPPSVLAA